MATRAVKSPKPPTSSDLTVTILGCGTSTGVPLIQCSCSVCRSRNPKNRRTRSSIWVQTGGKSLLIDTGPDFRAQALRERISRIDAVLYTHPHADHAHGIDDLRSFNYIQGEPIPVYGNAWVAGELPSRFPYIFKGYYDEKGGGIPQLTMNRFDASSEFLDIQGVRVTPIPLEHGKMESVGYRFDKFAYVTDCSYIPTQSLDRLRGLSVLILDCIRIQPHGTHFNLDQALATVNELRPQKTFLTHLGHDFDYAKWSPKTSKAGRLPKGVYLAYDGLSITWRGRR